MKLIFLCAAVLALSACATSGVPVETKWKTVTVTVRGPCPEPAVFDGLVASRPKPLREQPMPATAVERNAQTNAQLGRYEGEGKWGDQTEAALRRCQQPAEVSRVESAP